jgi:hypothetical protein
MPTITDYERLPEHVRADFIEGATPGGVRRRSQGLRARERGAHLDSSLNRHHDVYVRTTLTLDDDLAARLKELAHRRGISFKEALNAALRRGLLAPEGRGRRARPFRVRTFKSPFQPGVDPLKLNQLSDEIEVRRFRGGA